MRYAERMIGRRVTRGVHYLSGVLTNEEYSTVNFLQHEVVRRFFILWFCQTNINCKERHCAFWSLYWSGYFVLCSPEVEQLTVKIF